MMNLILTTIQICYLSCWQNFLPALNMPNLLFLIVYLFIYSATEKPFYSIFQYICTHGIQYHKTATAYARIRQNYTAAC